MICAAYRKIFLLPKAISFFEIGTASMMGWFGRAQCQWRGLTA
jgi:hypothetical protein